MKDEIDLSDRLSVDELEAALYDPAKRAEVSLDEIFEDHTAEDIIEESFSRALIEEERRGKRILVPDSDRSMSRILFITKDRTHLDPESMSMRTILSLAALVDEVHIIVFTPFGSREVTKRYSDNVWIYSASAQFWWLLPFAARAKAKEQLSFVDGFRPDVIVGLDPFESGLAALLIGKKYDRPVQIHVRENFTQSSFTKGKKGNRWRKRLAKYVLRRADSIRTETSVLEKIVGKIAPRIDDIHSLPRYHNFKALIDAEPSFDVHEKYQQFVFTILTIGDLRADSHLHDTFSALNDILHNPRIGLIVIGDGPARGLFEKKTEILGIKKNVVFVPQPDDLVSYLKTSDVLVETDTSKESEVRVLMAAAAGLPLIMYETDFRNDMFKDGESASIIESGDVYTLSRNVTAFVNNQALRIQYEEAAQYMVKTRLSEDEGTYYRALRDSIEIVLASPEVGHSETVVDEASLGEQS